MPFVRTDRTGAARYHGVVRAPMLRLRRHAAPALWSAVHTRLAGLYERRRRALEEEIRGEPGRPWMHAEWRAVCVEELYHLLCAGPRAALPACCAAGVDACRADTAVARAWARVVADAAEDTGAEHLRAWSDACRAALADERTGALAVLELLLSRPGLDDAGRVAAYNAHGLRLFHLGRLREALDSHGRAVALDPADPWGHHGLAVTHRALGEYETALRHLDAAEEAAPGAEWVARDRGETYRRMGRPEEALPWLDRAHALLPREPLTLGSRGQAKFTLGRAREALADLDRAIGLWPDYAWALTRRARVRQSLGDTAGALADLDRRRGTRPGRGGHPGRAGRRAALHGPPRGGRRRVRARPRPRSGVRVGVGQQGPVAGGPRPYGRGPRVPGRGAADRPRVHVGAGAAGTHPAPPGIKRSVAAAKLR